jgi:hypothetical protein
VLGFRARRARLGDEELLSLVIEWPAGAEKPAEFLLTSLPKRMAKKRSCASSWKASSAKREQALANVKP